MPRPALIEHLLEHNGTRALTDASFTDTHINAAVNHIPRMTPLELVELRRSIDNQIQLRERRETPAAGPNNVRLGLERLRSSIQLTPQQETEGQVRRTGGEIANQVQQDVQTVREGIQNRDYGNAAIAGARLGAMGLGALFGAHKIVEAAHDVWHTQGFWGRIKALGRLAFWTVGVGTGAVLATNLLRQNRDDQSITNNAGTAPVATPPVAPGAAPAPAATPPVAPGTAPAATPPVTPGAAPAPAPGAPAAPGEIPTFPSIQAFFQSLPDGRIFQHNPRVRVMGRLLELQGENLMIDGRRVYARFRAPATWQTVAFSTMEKRGNNMLSNGQTVSATNVATHLEAAVPQFESGRVYDANYLLARVQISPNPF